MGTKKKWRWWNPMTAIIPWITPGDAAGGVTPGLGHRFWRSRSGPHWFVRQPRRGQQIQQHSARIHIRSCCLPFPSALLMWTLLHPGTFRSVGVVWQTCPIKLSLPGDEDVDKNLLLGMVSGWLTKLEDCFKVCFFMVREWVVGEGLIHSAKFKTVWIWLS